MAGATALAALVVVGSFGGFSSAAHVAAVAGGKVAKAVKKPSKKQKAKRSSRSGFKVLAVASEWTYVSGTYICHWQGGTYDNTNWNIPASWLVVPVNTIGDYNAHTGLPAHEFDLGPSTSYGTQAACIAAANSDTTPPSVSSIVLAGSSPTNAATVSWTVTFNEGVTGVAAANFSIVNGGLTGPSLGTVTKVTDSQYTVTANTGTGSGTIGLNLSSNGSIKDLFNNNFSGATVTGPVYTIDKTAPAVTNVTSSTANGTYGVGTVIPVTVTFNEVVNVTGTPQLALSTGSPSATALNYSSGSGTNALTFNYTVVAGNASADLAYSSSSALTLNGGTIQDVAANGATLTLAAPGAAGSLNANKDIVISAAVGLVFTNVKINGTSVTPICTGTIGSTYSCSVASGNNAVLTANVAFANGSALPTVYSSADQSIAMTYVGKNTPGPATLTILANTTTSTGIATTTRQGSNTATMTATFSLPGGGTWTAVLQTP